MHDTVKLFFHDVTGVYLLDYTAFFLYELMKIDYFIKRMNWSSGHEL